MRFSPTSTITCPECNAKSPINAMLKGPDMAICFCEKDCILFLVDVSIQKANESRPEPLVFNRGHWLKRVERLNDYLKDKVLVEHPQTIEDLQNRLYKEEQDWLEHVMDPQHKNGRWRR